MTISSRVFYVIKNGGKHRDFFFFCNMDFLLSVYLAKQQLGCWYMQGLKEYYIALNNCFVTDEVKFLFPVRFTQYSLCALRSSSEITSADLPTQPGKKRWLLAGHCHLPLWNNVLQSFYILCKPQLLGVQKSSHCRLTNVSVFTDWTHCLTDVFATQGQSAHMQCVPLENCWSWSFYNCWCPCEYIWWHTKCQVQIQSPQVFLPATRWNVKLHIFLCGLPAARALNNILLPVCRCTVSHAHSCNSIFNLMSAVLI